MSTTALTLIANNNIFNMKILSFEGMSKRAVQVQINIDKYSYELRTSIFVTVSFTNIRKPKVGMGRILGISHGIPQAIMFPILLLLHFTNTSDSASPVSWDGPLTPLLGTT